MVGLGSLILQKIVKILSRPIQYLNMAQISTKAQKRPSEMMIAVIQLNSTNDIDKNFEMCELLVRKASKKGAKIAFLPEGCDYLANSKKESKQMAGSIKGHLIEKYCKLAGSCDMWISAGGVHIKEPDDNKPSNTHVLIDNLGKVVSTYSKTHMFDVEIPEKAINLKESTYVKAGDLITNPVQTSCGMVALGVCYDMRFPEFSLLQRKLGAQILTFPSAFTIPTGEAHWHTVLRARAIETQCYVVAAAQTGQHNAKRASYGHALVVDPWGTIIAEVSEGCDIALANIDLEYLEKIRKEMPFFTQRRHDLYSLSSLSIPRNECRLTEILPFPSANVSYDFFPFKTRGNSIFLKTSLSQAFTNKKPFTDGHMLVTPERFVERFRDFHTSEVSDLAQTVVLAVKILRKEFPEEKVVQIVIQDGIDAGKTVQHLHVHIMPCVVMKQGYEKIESRWRTEEEMASEAFSLRVRTRELIQSDTWLLTSEIPKPMRLVVTDEPVVFDDSQPISGDRVFVRSELSFACLAEDPVLPGHAFVSCLRGGGILSSLEDLSPREVVDLFFVVQKVQKMIESFSGCSSTTIFVSDQFQSSQPLCVHVVPRREDDLDDNNDIYGKLLHHRTKAANSSKDTEEFFDFINNKIWD